MARKIINCQSCGARFDVSKIAAGKRFQCGRCSTIVTVPIEDGAPAAAAPAAPVVQPAAPSRSVAVSRPVQSRALQSGPVQAPRAAPPPPPPPPAPPPPPPTAPTDGDPLTGKVIHGQYRIIRKLGEGGYGAVYEAKDVNLERRVAIKIMLQARAQSREYVAKFLREARTAAQLSHPNVVAVHGVGFDRDLGVHFLAMEYVEGRTLHDVLQERGPLPVEEACNYIIQSCRGLQAAHERNIIHRDIKPGNLMITPGGAIKIADFGLAKVYDAEGGQSTVIGTPYFMPPEQFEGKAKDGRTDIYALGVTFYYMLTMQRPHTGAGPAQILLSVMTKEPPSVLEHRPDLPEGIWPIVRRMIQRDPDKRYGTCDEVVQDLERLLGGGQEEIEQLYCPACGVPNDVDATACSGCNESLQETCPVCGATDAAGTKFCGDCGSNIPLERAVHALLDEATAFLSVGRLLRAREKLQQAQERSPQNLRVAQLFRDLEVRREQRDAHRDAVRELLAHGRPQDALSRWEAAKKEFPESVEISDLESDVKSALAARDVAGSAGAESIAGARALEQQGRVREALVAWRSVLVLSPDNEEAHRSEARLRETADRADELAAEGAEALQRGDPETAKVRIDEAAALLPGDPVIEGRRREAERAVAELVAELERAELEMKSGPSSVAADRLRMLAARSPGSRRVREALERAEHAGRAASAGAVRDRIQRSLDAARRHVAAHHLRDAVVAFRAVVDLDPDHAEAVEGMAQAQRAIAESEALLGQSKSLLASGDPEGAVAAAQQALDRLADDPAAAAQFARARTTLETMTHEADRIRASLGTDADEDVLGWARELAARFPGSTLAADVLRETEKACREAEEKASESRVKSLVDRARKLELDLQLERAAQAYAEAARIAPGNVEVKRSLQVLRERLDAAAKKTDEAQARLDAGDPDAARALAEEAQKLLPDQVRAAGVLAGARTALAEIDRALSAFEVTPDVDRAEAQLERLRRLAAKYQGSTRAADAAKRAARVVEDARATARRQRIASQLQGAETALAEGRLADAEKACAAAREIDPSDAVVGGLLKKIADRRARAAALVAEGRAHEAGGRLTQALAAFEDALASDPECAEATAARDAATAALERTREQIRKAQNDAVQAERAGRPRDAIEAWERLLALEPSHERALQEAARLREWLARGETALAKVAERMDAGDPEAALAAAEDARTRIGAWNEMDTALAKARESVTEVNRGVREIERDLAGEGDLAAVVARARALAGRFPGSTKARDTASRAVAVADERRRSAAASQVGRLVREHRYDAAVRAAADFRAEGLASPALDAAEAQARRVIDEVARLRAQAREQRTAGDLDAALESLRQVQTVLPDDADARQDVHDLEETLREFAVHVDTAETARRRGELSRAVEAFREALTLNPAAPGVRERMDALAEQQQRRLDLVRACEQAIRDGDGESCTKRAREILGLFPDDEAARNLQTTGDSMRNLVGSLLAHARRQRESGEPDSARITLECVLRIAPKNAEAQALLAG